MNVDKDLISYCDLFYKKYKILTCIGCELEFYADCDISTYVPDLNVVKEEGTNQFEIRFFHTVDLSQLINNIHSTKNLLLDKAKTHNFQISFDAKPFDDQPGNAFNVHINFVDEFGNNIFDIDKAMMFFTIGGLLNSLESDMKIFAPQENSYKRLVKSMFTPTNISWGYNNRTTALRVLMPPSYARRIEHRVPGADTDPESVILAILRSAHEGIANKIQPQAPTYGNAFDEQYALKPLNLPSKAVNVRFEDRNF